MPKYNVNDFYSDEAKKDMKEVMLEIMKPATNLTEKEFEEDRKKFAKRQERYEDSMAKGINVIETAFIGPFTLNELMEGVGLNPADYDVMDKLQI
ncbi:MAG: hypothetical protein IKY94_08275 [Lachnospiraceae bacterium]|nr:hypothetical protein [Lachnospiraceae bacterium]